MEEAKGLAGSMLVDSPLNMDNENKNYSVNYKSADSGWQIRSIRTNIVICADDTWTF